MEVSPSPNHQYQLMAPADVFVNITVPETARSTVSALAVKEAFIVVLVIGKMARETSRNQPG